MDNTWIGCTNRLGDVYKKGVKDFLQFTFKDKEPNDEIPCPCKTCNNVLYQTRDQVQNHLIFTGIVPSYTRWLHHGEFAAKKQKTDNNEVEQKDVRREQGKDMFEMINNIVGPKIMDDCSGVKFKHDDTSEPASKFSKLLENAAQQLYPGCETFSKLSLIIELFQIKCLHGLSDKAVDSILKNQLKLIKRALSFDGSERLAKADVQSDRLKEAQNINRSLSALGDVISTLANTSSHIPYRRAPELATDNVHLILQAGS
ncbi:hypothetical protein T459_30456 [Capsicum annuum]|uniref:Kinesin motor domain-containing protein n=1 Tax=Capsicum annuum TaxID=4072 RepID=A0A2G2Y906_CAPAN|nr:hypothetical protein FXO37_08633 [Capsicum annuum]PHT66031.1 hypothetical protein T459_30456 [Capsicum annuum]